MINQESDVVFRADQRRDWTRLPTDDPRGYLHDQYQQRAVLGKEEDKLIREYITNSERARNKDDVSVEEYEYGDATQGEVIRVFKPSTTMPGNVAIGFHGGYFRIPSKMMNGSAWFDFPALGLNPHGIPVIFIHYPTMDKPGVTMEKLATATHQAMKFIDDNSENIGLGMLEKAHIFGHSAGGLLALLQATENSGISPGKIESVTSISGVHDLGFASHPQSHLRLDRNPIDITQADAEVFSPMYLQPLGISRASLFVGAQESPEYHWQSRELARRWCDQGVAAHYESVPSQNHYTLCGQLADPESMMARHIVETMRIRGSTRLS